MPAFEEYVLLLRDWFFLGIALAIPMFALARLHRSPKWGLLGPSRSRAVPWSGPEVLGAFFIYYLATGLFLDVFRQHDLLSAIYGPHAGIAGTDNPRLSLWAATAALPFQVLGTLFLLHLCSQTLPYQVGLTTSRFGPNVLVGYVAWLLLTPTVLFLHAVTQRVYELTTFYKPEPHPIQKLMLDSPLPSDWVLTALTAIVAAPLVEELLYRGVLQQWLRSLPWRCDIIVAVSLFVAVFTRQKGIADAITSKEMGLLLWELQPAGFVLLLLPVYLLIRHRQRSPAPTAVFASSLMFAIWHAPVWPSPIPLFPLGLGLGWLAYRTQSLVAPIVVHMLFNAVAVLAMAHEDARLPEAPKGKPTTSTVICAVEVSVSSFVPGSSEPRRT
jgi:membrane protease YdiL (CAAX protease family)